jgi:hypothetical protein
MLADIKNAYACMHTGLILVHALFIPSLFLQFVKRVKLEVFSIFL